MDFALVRLSRSTADAAGTRPGGRSARVRAAVHRAVEDLVAEGVLTEDLTIPVVAARAGAVLHAGDLARIYGFTDADGTQPERFRVGP